MTSMTSMLLGAKGNPAIMPKPPASAIRRCNLANWDSPIGSVDTDDGSYSSLADLIEFRHKTTQDRLKRMAWAIRRTGAISNFEMSTRINVCTSNMSKLWSIFVEQGWVFAERKGGRHSLHYTCTDLGKRIFDQAVEDDPLKKAA